MSRDFYIDPITGDLAKQNFNLRFTETDTEILSQRVERRLRLFFGEYFLNRDIGVKYFENIFLKNFDINATKNILKNEALKAEGITEVLKFDLSFDNQTRKITISSEFKGDSGQIVTVETAI